MSILNHSADATERLAQAVAHMQHAFSLIHSVDPGIVARLASVTIALPCPPSPGLHRPETSIIDEGTFSVRWANLTCRLGNTVSFKLLARLARRPNLYIPCDVLYRDVWRDEYTSPEAVRSAVKVLRRKLTAAGMEDLARAIKGTPRHYALMLAEW